MLCRLDLLKLFIIINTTFTLKEPSGSPQTHQKKACIDRQKERKVRIFIPRYPEALEIKGEKSVQAVQLSLIHI